MSAVPANITDPFEVCSQHPHLDFCKHVRSFYEYPVSLPANGAFLGIFSALLVGYLAVYALTRRGLGFTVALVLGLICEILGYAGRVISANNPFDENGFLMQICCLTIGPAFMAAGVYLCLRRIVYAFGPESSRIPPEWYTRVFIPCDVISLILQATGGGMASVASHNHKSVDPGDNIMIAGLSFQVLTLLLFMLCSLDFAVRATRRHRRLGAAAFDQSAAASRVRSSKRFRGFLAGLALATICIFWRSVFRVAELSKGWTGPIMRRQGLFIGFEGVMIVAACLAMLLFHPSVCFRELMEGAGGIEAGRLFGRKRDAKVVDTLPSEPVSDAETAMKK